MLQKYDARNADIIVNVAGKLTHRNDAAVSPFDSSVQNGDAVWEGLRLYDGKIFRLSAHLARLRKSAQMLSYTDIPSDEKIITQIKRTLEANNMQTDVHIRLTLTRGVKYTSGLDPRINTMGSTLIVLAEYKPPVYDKSGLALIIAKQRRPFADVLDQHIHSSNQLTSILAKLEANATDADDAMMLDTKGFVAETNATHLFLVKDGRVETPTTKACPEGITRAAVLELCQTHGIPHLVDDILPERFFDADEVFCTGTMGEIVPVVRIDGNIIGSGTRSPITQQLSSLYSALVKEESESLGV
ncbi:MAG: aminotransferase class IV [Phycisphaeraceae bacterium]|nr:aminotransferase class IV [Phycisphaerales bacterium]MCB9861690.1 aminotransferase class IV [Phycisphaeraceae bacterium]